MTVQDTPPSAAGADTLGQILARLAGQPGALLPILHAVQDALGHIAPDSVPRIAEALNLSRAEVHGVITYYHHFRTVPKATHIVQICRAEACQAMGANQLLAHASLRLGCEVHGHSADGKFSLEPAFCLGLCAQSPAMTLDDAPHARITPQRFDALLAQVGGAA